MQPISEYCEDSYLSSSFGGDIFAAEKCLVYGYKTLTVAFFTDRNTSIAFDSIKPAIEEFIKIINTDGGTFFDKQKSFDEYMGELDHFSVPLFSSYDEFEDVKASLVFSINYTASCNVSRLDYSGGGKFLFGYKLNRMLGEGQYNYNYLFIALPEEAKINKAESDGLIDDFCHNNFSFNEMER